VSRPSIRSRRSPSRTTALVTLVVAALGPAATGEHEDTEASAGSEGVTASAPVLDLPALPPAPIIAACGHLLDAETIRIALPAHHATLLEALRLASLGSGVPIQGDWAALDGIGLDGGDELDLPTSPATVPVLLEQVVSRLTNAWDRPRLEATSDGLLLTTPAGAERLVGTVVHPIGDLLHGDPLPTAIPGDPPPKDPEAIRSLVQALIEPDAWSDAGGRLGQVEIWEETLLITAPPSMQVGVRRLLDQLRAARPVELEADLDLVRIDAESARRIEMSRGVGSLAAVRAVAATASTPSLLSASLCAPVDGTLASTTCRSASVSFDLSVAPTWDPTRRRLRCRVRLHVEGDDAGGVRTLEVEQEVAVPVGGLVLPLPVAGDQPPLTLLVTLRAR
jgi:hypothetical protein